MDTMPLAHSGLSSTRRLAVRCVALAALIFLGLQGAQYAYYFQHTAHAGLQIRKITDYSSLGVEVKTSGRVLLTPRLASDILGVLPPAERQTFLADTGHWLDWRSPSAEDLLIRECVGRIGDENQHGLRDVVFVVGATDRLMAEAVGRGLVDSILQFNARRRIEQDMVEVNLLSAEIAKLGDRAPDEMRQKLRAMSFGSFRTETLVRKIAPGAPVISEGKRFMPRRFMRLAAWNAGFASLVGAAVFGVCALRRR